MIYLLYGGDTYRSRENLREIARKFFEAGNPKERFYRMTEDDFDKNLFLDLCRTASMFGGKYLISAERILGGADIMNFIFENIKSAEESENIFVFWEEELDDVVAEKIKLFVKNAQEFSLLTGAKLKNWIKHEAENMNCKISAGEIDILMQDYGSDLWGIKSELEMMSLGGNVQHRKLNISADSNMFDIADAFSARDKRRAIMLFEKYKSEGIPAEEIFWKILWQARVLLAVKKLSARSPAEIQKVLKFHPFVIKKSLAACSKFEEAELDAFNRRLIEIYQQSRIGSADLDANLMRLFLRF